MEFRGSTSPEASFRETSNILECLTNLIYLTRLEADSPDRVRQYMDLSEERMEAVVKVLGYRC